MSFRTVASIRIAATLAAVTLLITAIVPAAQAAIGRVPGGGSVSQTGMASYVIPIRATPGVRGLAPALAIAYTGSPDVRGMLGVGFTLAGLSSIEPCPRTIAQDGQYAPVLLGTGDRYCRDGQRLIADIVGTDGANLATYRTEIDQIARVTSYTAVGATQPDWFKVETGDGLIWQYGAVNAQGTVENSEALTSATSTGKTFEWLVKTIMDRAGNVLTFTYDNDPSQKRLRPSLIQYTGRTPTGGGDYRVDFSSVRTLVEQIQLISGFGVALPTLEL